MSENFSEAQTLLAAFLFGAPLPPTSWLQPLKSLGIYHLVAFSGFNVYFWRRLLRRWGMNMTAGAFPWGVECCVWGLLLGMHVLFHQGWSARRALVMQCAVFIFGAFAGRGWRGFWIQVSAVCLLLMIQPKALSSMAVWMSLSGSLALSALGRIDAPPGRLTELIIFVVVTLMEWFIARYFGVSFFISSALIVGGLLSLVISRFFGWIVLIYGLTHLSFDLRQSLDQLLILAASWARTLEIFLCRYSTHF